MGKVGTGLDDRLLASIEQALAETPRTARPFRKKPPDDSATRWVEPRLVCEVRFASLTTEGTLREPVFLRLRPDLAVEDCDDGRETANG
jgi:bifunctional non-homologous end joining protein LigD